MSETSRRRFIGVAGAGAVAAGATVVVPQAASASPAKAHANAAKERVVAYVSDHRSSTLTVLVGDREVAVHDRDLVQRLLNAAGR